MTCYIYCFLPEKTTFALWESLWLVFYWLFLFLKKKWKIQPKGDPIQLLRSSCTLRKLPTIPSVSIYQFNSFPLSSPSWTLVDLFRRCTRKWARAPSQPHCHAWDPSSPHTGACVSFVDAAHRCPVSSSAASHNHRCELHCSHTGSMLPYPYGFHGRSGHMRSESGDYRWIRIREGNLVV